SRSGGAHLQQRGEAAGRRPHHQFVHGLLSASACLQWTSGSTEASVVWKILQSTVSVLCSSTEYIPLSGNSAQAVAHSSSLPYVSGQIASVRKQYDSQYVPHTPPPIGTATEQLRRGWRR